MSNIGGLTLAAVMTCSSVGAKEMDSIPLELSVQCPGSSDCGFDGRTIEMEVTVKNVASDPIEMPLEYLQKRGIFAEVFDRTSGKSTSMRVTFANPELLTVWEVVPAGTSFLVSTRLSASQIAPLFSNRDNNVEAVLSLSIPVRMKNGDVALYATPHTVKIPRIDPKPIAPTTARELTKQELDQLLKALD